MLKPFLTLFYLSMYGSLAVAQSPQDRIFFQQNIAAIPVHSHPLYYAAILKNDLSFSEKKLIQQTIKRKYSETAVILSIADTLSMARLLEFAIRIAPSNNDWKLSPSIIKMLIAKTDSEIMKRFYLQADDDKFGQSFHLKHTRTSFEISPLAVGNIFTVKASWKNIHAFFLNDDRIVAIGLDPGEAKEELGIQGFDFSANNINIARNDFPGVQGAGMHISLKEHSFNFDDIDLKGRQDSSPLVSPFMTDHADFMATLIAGAGNSAYYAKGVAPEAYISSSSFEIILPDNESYYITDSITVQNHSYGTAIDNSYGINAVAYDTHANLDTGFLHVFSSGNSGDSVSPSGNYNGIPGYANLTGNFKMAKNVIVVGAVDSFGNVPPMSSKGPAYDGRIKPDLVAFQKNGSSESAALTSGTCLLLQQYYKNETNSVLPSALARAVLLNSARDVATPGPDYASGFGNLDALAAMNCLKQNNIFSGNLSPGGKRQFPLTIPVNTSRIKITLSWNDPAAAAFTPVALINDLDLLLKEDNSGFAYQPWVLSSFPDSDSLLALPHRGRDSLNNNEQITLDFPAAGNYTLSVSAHDLQTSLQSFYIAYSIDSTNTFKWEYPIAADLIEGGVANVLRWQTNISNMGNIEYSLGGASNWKSITNTILKPGHDYWVPPDTICVARLRMNVSGKYIYSDSFFITKLLHPATGFICGDSLLLHWENVPPVKAYQLYELGAKYMEVFKTVADTFDILSTHEFDGKYLAVAPILQNNAATKSYALNYTLQGTGCYVNSFIANVNGNTANLSLEIGTLYHVDSIVFEIFDDGRYKKIYSLIPVVLKQVSYYYPNLKQGTSSFRVKIILTSGEVVYSDVQSVFYAKAGRFIIFPNPVLRSNDININTTLPNEEVIIIYDLTGRLLHTQSIQSTNERVRTSRLERGIYFYKIVKGESTLQSGKILIL